MTITRCLRAAGLASLFLCSFLEAQQLNLIQKENRQPGTTAWQLTNPTDNRQIEGYASLTSVAVGGDISLFVNTADTTYSLMVFRMGWYGVDQGKRYLSPPVHLRELSSMPCASIKQTRRAPGNTINLTMTM